MRIRNLLLLFTLSILLLNCHTRPFLYHSEANLPYFHNLTKTSFKLIIDERDKVNFEFGIISARDNDTLNYILIAPGRSANVGKLRSVNLYQSVPLLPQRVKAFIEVLNVVEEKWDKDFDGKEGINYEFIIAPEDRIIQKSENVAEWYSAFKFNFQNNEGGPLCTIIFSGEFFQKVYYLREKEKIQKLIELLEMSISEQ